MKYTFIIIILLFCKFGLARNKSNDTLYLRFPIGLQLDNFSISSGKVEGNADITRLVRINYSVGFGQGQSKIYTQETKRDAMIKTIIHDVGFSFSIRKKRNQNILLGLGYSQQKFKEQYNHIVLPPDFLGGTASWFDTRYTTAQGMYIKPQFELKYKNKCYLNLYAYANMNGYKNLYGIGSTISLINLRLKPLSVSD